MFFDFFRKKEPTIKPTMLLVLDGFGVAPDSPGNAISQAQKPTFDYLYAHFPHTQLIASGEVVGLPANEVGNSEVGHLTIGAGKTVLQSLPRIQKSITQGTINYNKPLLSLSSWVKTNHSALHLVGLLSSGEVHASYKHLYGLLDWCKYQQLPQVFLHLFTDGRDAPLQDGLVKMRELENTLSQFPQVHIASITGRYYAMDRDGRWERAMSVYSMMTQGSGARFPSGSALIDHHYQKGVTDEFIPPSLVEQPDASLGLVKDKDAILFFNFRADRARQLALSFVRNRLDTTNINIIREAMGMKSEEREKNWHALAALPIPEGLKVVTFTEYHTMLPVDGVAFPVERAEGCLPQIVSEIGWKQIHLAESEKERMVKYYFDGLHESPFAGEETFIVASPKVATYDKTPEMSLKPLANKIIQVLKSDTYPFLMANFANPDMVAHSGNVQATIKAIEAVDREIKRIMDEILARGGKLFITADHGNAEEMLTYKSESYFFATDKGKTNTEHSANPVPFIVIDQQFFDTGKKMNSGTLVDVAPTILSLWGVPVPPGMTGKTLIEN